MDIEDIFCKIPTPKRYIATNNGTNKQFLWWYGKNHTDEWISLYGKYPNIDIPSIQNEIISHILDDCKKDSCNKFRMEPKNLIDSMITEKLPWKIIVGDYFWIDGTYRKWFMSHSTRKNGDYCTGYKTYWNDGVGIGIQTKIQELWNVTKITIVG